MKKTVRLPDFISSMFFPKMCLSCGAVMAYNSIERLCPDCSARDEFEPRLVRRKAGEKFFAAAPFIYDKTPKRVILSLKYRGMGEAAGFLAKYMTDVYRSVGEFTYDEKPIVIPVPSSRKRRRKRGYNQAELIARSFCGLTGLALETKAVVKTIDNKRQAAIHSAAERAENVKGAYWLKHPERVAGKHVIVVDDVITTSATITEVCRCLDGTAESICCLCAASTNEIGKSLDN